MNFLTSRLFQLARSDAASYFIGYAFEYASSLIPVRRLFEDRTVLAFKHPVPFWAVHYLIVPKRRIPTFISLNFEDRLNIDYVLQILQTAQVLARQSHLEQYTILVNGGAYQDVPQLHFHLASGSRWDDLPMYVEQNLPVNSVSQAGSSNRECTTCEHPSPVRVYHKLIMARNDVPHFWRLDFFNPHHRLTLTSLLKLTQHEIANSQLDRYTVLFNVSNQSPGYPLQLHLVSGDSI